MRRLVAVIVVGLIIGAGIAWVAKPAPERGVAIDFWHVEQYKERVAKVGKIIDEFEETHPNIDIHQVGIPEGELSKKIVAAKAAGELPDVIEIWAELSGAYAEEGLVDTEAVTDVIESVGENKFAQGVLRMMKNPAGPGYSSVPFEAWLQGVWYRKDWFEEKGLAPPTTWDAIKTAAKAFNDPPNRYGIALSTDPEDLATVEFFEQFALANGTRLFSKEGEPIVDSPEMREALEFYTGLKPYMVPGKLNHHDSRDYYFTGKAAMTLYSSYFANYIADPEKTPISDLYKKTGVVTVTEHDGGKGSYALARSLAIGSGHSEDKKEAAKEWVRYLVTDGMNDWCRMVIAGMIPLNKSNLSEWKNDDFWAKYPEEMPDELVEGVRTAKKWGIREGKYFPVVKDVRAHKDVGYAIWDVLQGEKTVAEATSWIQERMEGYE